MASMGGQESWVSKDRMQEATRASLIAASRLFTKHEVCNRLCSSWSSGPDSGRRKLSTVHCSAPHSLWWGCGFRLRPFSPHHTALCCPFLSPGSSEWELMKSQLQYCPITLSGGRGRGHFVLQGVETGDGCWPSQPGY